MAELKLFYCDSDISYLTRIPSSQTNPGLQSPSLHDSFEFVLADTSAVFLRARGTSSLGI